MNDEHDIRSLYRQLLGEWNRRHAGGFAALFTADGRTVGFDGSLLDGPRKIESELAQIFAHHQTAAYVGKVRDVRFLSADVAVLCAAAGMVAPGDSDIDPAVNAIQTLVADRRDGRWRIALFQNTPAAFHGRPQLVEKLSEELRAELRATTGQA